MNREDRAKQFLPFDSLKGLREELIKREEMYVYLSKPVLSEERIAELCENIGGADFTKEHTLTYYSSGKILQICGIFKINKEKKEISFGEEKIRFSDILAFI